MYNIMVDESTRSAVAVIRSAINEGRIVTIISICAFCLYSFIIEMRI